VQLYNKNQRNAQFYKLIRNFDVLYMFRTSWVHPLGDSCICTYSPIRQTAHTDACKTYRTAYTAVPMRINPRGPKHVGDIRNYILIHKIKHFVGFYCIILVLLVYSTYNRFEIDKSPHIVLKFEI